MFLLLIDSSFLPTASFVVAMCIAFLFSCCPKALGIVHVLTGPDHLSAIATLSVNVGDFRAFWYGIRWGIGHSIGLIVVGSVFIALENIHFDQGTIEDGSIDNSSRIIEIPENIENLHVFKPQPEN